jgi:RND superfamily putative drug exporter
MAESLVDRRAAIALGWLVLALLLLPRAPGVGALLVAGVPGASGEAHWVEDVLEREFAAPFAKSAVLVVRGVPPPADPAGAKALREVVDEVEAVPAVRRTLSWLDVRDARFLSDRGTFLVAGLRADGRADDPMLALRAASARASSRLRAEHPRIELDWTGGVAFEHDVRSASSQEAHAAEAIVLPVVAIVLVFVFRSVVAALIPVVLGALAIGFSLGAAALLAARWPLAVLLENVVTMIGLGLGIDYALLMVSRFREALAAGADPRTAAIEAARRAGGTIALSGTAVAIGFAALFLVPVSELRSIAVGGLVVVAFSVGLATTLLPGTLVAIGRRVEWGSARRGPAATPDRWTWWGRVVVARPGWTLLVFATPLALIAWHAPRFSTHIPSGLWLPEAAESTRGARALQAMGRTADLETLRIVVELPPGRSASDPDAWRALRRLGDAIAADPRTAEVRSLATMMGEEPPSAERLDAVPPDLRGSYLGREPRLALVEVVPREGGGHREVMECVRALRRLDLAAFGYPEGTRARVGGPAAFDVDYEEAVGENTGVALASVVAATFLALTIAFGSPFVAAKAVALNLASVAVAMGAAVLAFQDGHGIGPFGAATPIDGLFPASLALVFTLVFALSMDYEIFLLARIWEAARSGLAPDEAIVEGLARSASLVTSAALVMAIVFAGFAAGDFLVIKILGFMLTVAVVVDATVIRLALGPALMRLGGRWNRWPRPARARACP